MRQVVAGVCDSTRLEQWLAQLDNVGALGELAEYQELYNKCPDINCDMGRWLLSFIRGRVDEKKTPTSKVKVYARRRALRRIGDCCFC